mmetsp:Transcript_12603/g.30681  ORF Transcript_12603/g.30681 Transcript_12603/m.30681 type:complete len:333 (-) Transcript_12603:457-1455(-)
MGSRRRLTRRATAGANRVRRFVLEQVRTPAAYRLQQVAQQLVYLPFQRLFFAHLRVPLEEFRPQFAVHLSQNRADGPPHRLLVVGKQRLHQAQLPPVVRRPQPPRGESLPLPTTTEPRTRGRGRHAAVLVPADARGPHATAKPLHAPLPAALDLPRGDVLGRACPQQQALPGFEAPPAALHEDSRGQNFLQLLLVLDPFRGQVPQQAELLGKRALGNLQGVRDLVMRGGVAVSCALIRGGGFVLPLRPEQLLGAAALVISISCSSLLWHVHKDFAVPDLLRDMRQDGLDLLQQAVQARDPHRIFPLDAPPPAFRLRRVPFFPLRLGPRSTTI